ncbi:MAG: thioesterase [bacterium]|nr:thioesterase [bacterium]
MSTVNVFRKTGASKKIIMFPFGGGNGFSFVELINQIQSKQVEFLLINPPGHLFCNRKPLVDLMEMVGLYVAELRTMVKPQDELVIFGHSMGGIVAYEVCKILEKEYNVKKLFISAVNPPHSILDRIEMNSRMDNDTLLEASDKLGGIPGGFSGAMEKELLELFINALRSDLKALESIKPDMNPVKIKTPTDILYADQDVMEYTTMLEWDRYLEPERFIKFNGKHFYIFEAESKKRIAQLLMASHSLQPY